MKQNQIVCLDPGHGPGTVNGAPDGSYKEREFAWDMYTRIRPLLEARGVTVIGTRREDEKPSLAARAAVSNRVGADLFVSLHSNAAGNGGWYGAKGLLIFTSTAGEEAGRNRAAKAILARMERAGVALHGTGLLHTGYTVLTATAAPAVLIEYGFHTNREDVERLKDAGYRELLAKATAEGICDYLEVSAPAEDREEGLEDKPSDYAAGAWERAKALGVTDGTRPKAPALRQELVVMLDRLGLLAGENGPAGPEGR